MKSTIQQQKAAMQECLNTLNDIEVVERIFHEIDPTYTKVLVENLQKQYADNMEALLMLLPVETFGAQ